MSEALCWNGSMTDPAINHDPQFPSHRAEHPRRSAICLVVDAVLVLLFAVLGNISHESGLSPADIWSTAWPFLMGLALGWWITFSWRYPSNIWPVGLILVIFVVTWGMMLRHFATDGGVEVSFVVVATLVLGVLLLGRRLGTKYLLPRP